MNIDNIEQLIAEKKFDEVRAIILDASAQNFTDEEKGAVLTSLTEAYLDMSNSVNERYVELLQDAIKGMRAIKTSQVKVNEKIGLAEVREKLNQ